MCGVLGAKYLRVLVRNASACTRVQVLVLHAGDQPLFGPPAKTSDAAPPAVLPLSGRLDPSTPSPNPPSCLMSEVCRVAAAAAGLVGYKYPGWVGQGRTGQGRTGRWVPRWGVKWHTQKEPKKRECCCSSSLAAQVQCLPQPQEHPRIRSSRFHRALLVQVSRLRPLACCQLLRSTSLEPNPPLAPALLYSVPYLLRPCLFYLLCYTIQQQQQHLCIHLLVSGAWMTFGLAVRVSPVLVGPYTNDKLKLPVISSHSPDLIRIFKSSFSSSSPSSFPLPPSSHILLGPPCPALPCPAYSCLVKDSCAHCCLPYALFLLCKSVV